MSTRYKISYAPEALEDLRSIGNYIAGELYSPQASKRTLRQIRDAVRTLQSMPNRNGLVGNRNLASVGVRKLLVESHLILYCVNDKAASISVVRIIHAGRDLGRITV